MANCNLALPRIALSEANGLDEGDGQRTRCCYSLPVLYVATVHFRTPKWIDVQQSYLRRNIREPFKTYAVLDGIEEPYHSRFDRVVAAEGSHEGRLNLLAEEISVVAGPDDVILFLGRGRISYCGPHACRPPGSGDDVPHRRPPKRKPRRQATPPKFLRRHCRRMEATPR